LYTSYDRKQLLRKQRREELVAPVGERLIKSAMRNDGLVTIQLSWFERRHFTDLQQFGGSKRRVEKRVRAFRDDLIRYSASRGYRVTHAKDTPEIKRRGNSGKRARLTHCRYQFIVVAQPTEHQPAAR